MEKGKRGAETLHGFGRGRELQEKANKDQRGEGS